MWRAKRSNCLKDKPLLIPVALLSSVALPLVDISDRRFENSKALFIVASGVAGNRVVIMRVTSLLEGEGNTVVRNQEVTSSVIQGFEDEGGHAMATIRKLGCT